MAKFDIVVSEDFKAQIGLSFIDLEPIKAKRLNRNL